MAPFVQRTSMIEDSRSPAKGRNLFIPAGDKKSGIM